MKRKLMKKLGCFVLVFMMILQSMVMEVQAATTSSTVPIIAYTISTGRVTTYKSVNGAYSGYVDGSTDQCTIQKLYSSGWCRIKYPVSGGTKVAYTKTSNFFTNVDFSTTKTTLGSKKTVYRRSNLSQKLGTVYATDQIIIVGQSGGNTQIIYPLDSGGYKAGWISGTYSANGESEADLADGWYQIKSSINTNYVLDVYGASTQNCANVTLYQNQASLNQGFLIKRQSGQYYKIEALHSGLVLDVENAGKTSGTNVIQYQLNGNGSDNQLWKIYKTSDGYYRFQNKCNNLYLDVNGGTASNGVNVQVWESNDTKAQKFVLETCTVDGKSYESESTSTNTSSSSETIQKIVNYELSQVGVGDYRGNNNVVYNTWYYGRTVNGSGYAWCQVFQSYAADQCGVLGTAIPKTASCSNAVSWYKQRGLFHLSSYYGGTYVPKAGDLVFYGTNGASHVGMIVADPVDGYLQVVEGNVKTSSGDYKVCYFTRNSKRKLTSSYVYGYASPNY